MSEYIKLKDLIDTDCILVDEIECDDCPFYDKERFWCRMIDWIRSLPTIDIVHCKDCKHYISDGGALMTCEIHDGLLACENDFCSYGERIDE